MKMFLAVDRGNTLIKAVFMRVAEGEGPLCERVEVVETVSLQENEEDLLISKIESRGVDAVSFCSVGHIDVRLIETLRNAVGGNLLVLTHQSGLPITVEYQSGSIGLDRVAAAAGAYEMIKGEGALIVDAGTAVTIDVLDAGGRFRGGNIAPGVSLRFRSLHNETEALPLVDSAGALPDFGYDTPTAIRSGVLGGISKEILVSYLQSQADYGCKKIILTGGDSTLLYQSLKVILSSIKGEFPEITTDIEQKLMLHPQLVALGLLSIYKYNEKDL